MLRNMLNDLAEAIRRWTEKKPLRVCSELNATEDLRTVEFVFFFCFWLCFLFGFLLRASWTVHYNGRLERTTEGSGLTGGGLKALNNRGQWLHVSIIESLAC